MVSQHFMHSLFWRLGCVVLGALLYVRQPLQIMTQFIHSFITRFCSPQIRCVAADIPWQPSSLPCLGISSTM